MKTERLAFLDALNDRLRALQDPVEIQSTAVQLLGTRLGVSGVHCADINGDEFVVQSYENGIATSVTRGLVSTFAAYLRGETIVVNDVAGDPRLTVNERENLRANHVAAFVGATLRKDGRWMAAFGVHSSTPRRWTSDEIALIEGTGARMWAACEQTRMEDALRRSEERHAFLLRLSDALRPLSDPLEVQTTASRLLGEQLQVNRVGYAEIEDRKYVIRGEYTQGVRPLGSGSGGFGAALLEAYRRGDTVVVHDVGSDPRFTGAERVTMREKQIAAFIGVTLIKAGRLVAAFGANQEKPRLWTPTEIALVRDVAERTWDTAERARAESALREREHRLRLALDASAGGSWTWDSSTNTVDWDDRFRALYGFSPDEPPVSEAWVSRLHEEDRPRLLAFIEKVWSTPTLETWDNTYRVVRPDGSMLWMQSLGRADRDAAGRLIRLTGVDFDITQRRQAEEALQARRDEERDRELRLLLETATQGFVMLDAQGSIVTANHALATMFGWTPEELIGVSIEQLVPAFLRHHHGGSLFGQRNDRSVFPIEVSLNHIATPGGGRAIAFVTDISDRQRDAAALHERTVELEHRTAQLSRLTSDLTLAEHHAREQLAKTLHDGLQQMLLVATTRLDQQARIDAQRGIAPADKVVQAKAQLDEAIAAARSLSIELFPPVLHNSGLPAALTWLADWTRNRYGLEVQVSADPLANSSRKDVRTLLFESVRELLVNAVKHARVNRVSVDLTLDLDDQLRITVKDEGIGFDPAQLADRAKAGQIGWGLFSIRERLTLLGGRFDIDSAPERGARFRLIAPRGAANVADEKVSRLSRDSWASNVVNPPLGILLVDDHPAVRAVLGELLQERFEFRVVGHAGNGLEAIAQAHALRPDVILMDISMPEMDGIEATQRLRAELPSIQILGLSMQSRSGPRHPIEEAGAAGFYMKGTDTQRMIDHLLAIHTAVCARVRGYH